VLGSHLTILEQTASTNDDAKTAARAGAEHGRVWVAESQTAGRGRQGRTWSAKAGESLLFSVLMRVQCAPSRVPPVALAAGLAVRDAVAKHLGYVHDASVESDCLVKWPNDVLVRRPSDGALRKVAGVLVESSITASRVEFVVIGIGLNVHALAFGPDLDAIATSVDLERRERGIREPACRAEIVCDILEGLERDVDRVAYKGFEHVHARFHAHDALRGRAVQCFEGAAFASSSASAAPLAAFGASATNAGGAHAGRDGRDGRAAGEAACDDAPGVWNGTAAGVDSEGRLMVTRADGGIVHLASADVRLRVLPSRV